MSSNDEKWLDNYYKKLQPSYDYSLKKKDMLTYWSLTIIGIIVSINFGVFEFIDSDETIIYNSSLHLFILAGLIIIIIHFFGNSIIAYSYLSKWKHLQIIIEQYKIYHVGSYKSLLKEIKEIDHSDHGVVKLSTIFMSQLKAGFHIILSASALIFIYQFIIIGNYSLEYIIPSICILSFILYEVWSLKRYSRIQTILNPNKTKKLHAGSINAAICFLVLGLVFTILVYVIDEKNNIFTISDCIYDAIYNDSESESYYNCVAKYNNDFNLRIILHTISAFFFVLSTLFTTYWKF